MPSARNSARISRLRASRSPSVYCGSIASISRLNPCWALKTGRARTSNLIPGASCAPVARSNSGRMVSAVDCQITALALASTDPCASRSDTPMNTWPPLARSSTTSTMVHTGDRKAWPTACTTPASSCDSETPLGCSTSAACASSAPSPTSASAVVCASAAPASGSQLAKGVSARPIGAYHCRLAASQRAPSALAASLSLNGTAR